jgi:hypothetical protein
MLAGNAAQEIQNLEENGSHVKRKITESDDDSTVVIADDDDEGHRGERRPAGGGQQQQQETDDKSCEDSQEHCVVMDRVKSDKNRVSRRHEAQPAIKAEPVQSSVKSFLKFLETLFTSFVLSHVAVTVTRFFHFYNGGSDPTGDFDLRLTKAQFEAARAEGYQGILNKFIEHLRNPDVICGYFEAFDIEPELRIVKYATMSAIITGAILKLSNLVISFSCLAHNHVLKPLWRLTRYSVIGHSPISDVVLVNDQDRRDEEHEKEE